VTGEEGGAATPGGSAPAAFDTTVAHIARVYNYWLGGKDNFAADRAAGDGAIKAFPEIPLSARANRAFLARAVRFLASEVGIRQFLVLAPGDGSELPTSVGWPRWDTLGHNKRARGCIRGPITSPAAMSCSPVTH